MVRAKKCTKSKRFRTSSRFSNDQNLIKSQLAKGKNIRNPFLLFLDIFRRQQKHKASAYQNATKAARKWNRMTLMEKQPYIEAAVKTSYVFKSKYQRVNRLIDNLRNVLPDEQTIKPELLPVAIAHLREWQHEIIEELMCSDD